MATVKFKPLEDVVGVNMVSISPIGIAINPSLAPKTIQRLTTLSRTRPTTMGHLPPVDSAWHLVVELVRKHTGCHLENLPYKGGAPAMNDAIAGHVDSTVSDVGVLAPMHKVGRLRIVLVTSDKRLPELPAVPDVPAAGDLTQSLVATHWIDVFAHAKTPRAALERLNAAIVKGINQDELRTQFQKTAGGGHHPARPQGVPGVRRIRIPPLRRAGARAWHPHQLTASVAVCLSIRQLPAPKIAARPFDLAHPLAHGLSSVGPVPPLIGGIIRLRQGCGTGGRPRGFFRAKKVFPKFGAKFTTTNSPILKPELRK